MASNKKLQALESFDSGSNYKFGDKLERAKNPKSLFDLSHLVSQTIANAGLIFPISVFEAIPGDDHDINIDALIRVMPQVVPLLSRQRLYVYGFYLPYYTLWNNWQVFMDRGFTGNVSKSIPTLNENNCVFSNSDSAYIRPESILDYLGLPQIMKQKKIKDAKISALPLMGLLRIYRDIFMNKNEFINDRIMLPDDDSRFRLDDDGTLLSAKDRGKTLKYNINYDGWTGTNWNDADFQYDNDGEVSQFFHFYHEYPDDYFMSAVPFTQRGTTPEKKLDIDTSELHLNSSNAFAQMGAEGRQTTGYLGFEQYNNEPYLIAGTSYQDRINGDNSYNIEVKKVLDRIKIAGDAISVGLTLEDIRRLAIQQTELEKLARTDGSYAQFGLTFFGEVSRGALDFRPTYIGGIYKNIIFTEVVQTAPKLADNSGGTTGSQQTPLGAIAGHGIIGINNGRLGHVHCDDYGLIMILGCIMPDVYYKDGLERLFTDSLQSEKYLPERAKLGLQPILNKEIFYGNNNGSNLGEDNYLWAYQNPFDYLRYIPNRVKGKIAMPDNNTFNPYAQMRDFTSLPNWGHGTSVARDVSKKYLFAPSESAYIAQFAINDRCVRALPYKAIPARII